MDVRLTKHTSIFQKSISEANVSEKLNSRMAGQQSSWNFFNIETYSPMEQGNTRLHYPHNMVNTIINEDCLVAMRDIPDGSIDMICCDLPYGVLHRGNPHAQWDRMIPFEPLWEQYERIIK